ncbi:hypothetical protein SODALDRAFT_356102 [Sodiomyces alkalinus F11]|uniref:Uncharacterized protein n=1 Tax=Sodiomyces alkalinus (strain CBS 110278 / VKM F-3762 / F11) TaxID=1314773 RepID=A0A3N2Q062_SODAK|nr:hypothetical protein SODALDRAFT_356102 [Sodiomyces alkalinus F11]ROT40159.1 hypothetical protein SODALDRAFT_356102 [Sodiomyces alkalinus F11]
MGTTLLPDVDRRTDTWFENLDDDALTKEHQAQYPSYYILLPPFPYSGQGETDEEHVSLIRAAALYFISRQHLAFRRPLRVETASNPDSPSINIYGLRPCQIILSTPERVGRLPVFTKLVFHGLMSSTTRTMVTDCHGCQGNQSPPKHTPSTVQSPEWKTSPHAGASSELVSSQQRPPAVAAPGAPKVSAKHPLTGPFENGYHFPPAHSWKESFRLGAIAFWKYTWTPIGFFIVLYGLLVVAWGGKLFLLLVNAAPAMCYPSCDDINSPRRKWIEIDSQIMNALFCVTGFGLAPWRFRDLYFLLRYRVNSDADSLRRLAGIHRSWFRLRDSDLLPVDVGPNNVNDLSPDLLSIPLPQSKIPDPPLTGIRAPPTSIWKMDFVIWFNVSNTFLQCVLSGFMWGMNRFDRPAWAVGLFVALACGAAATGGLMIFHEGKRVKKVEGVTVSERDLEQLTRDKELGIVHYNNIRDKKPKRP